MGVTRYSTSEAVARNEFPLSLEEWMLAGWFCSELDPGVVFLGGRQKGGAGRGLPAESRCGSRGHNGMTKRT